LPKKQSNRLPAAAVIKHKRRIYFYVKLSFTIRRAKTDNGKAFFDIKEKMIFFIKGRRKN
jgi:hypothetical protein